MRRYENLPSINVELQDGNLRIDRTPKGPVSLVIGLATDGPDSTQFLMGDSNEAAALFGSDSPLIQRAAQLKMGGSRNVLLYRVGGVSASFLDVFGTDSEVTAREKNVAANLKYKIYAGPNPDGVTAGAVLIIFEGTNNKIVYSNVPGGEVNLNRFDVVEFDTAFAQRIGTPTAPVALSNVMTSVVQDFTDSYVVGLGGETTHNLTGATTPGTVVTLVTVNGTPVPAGGGAGQYSFSAATDVITWGTPLVDTDDVVIEFTRPVASPTGTFTAGADNLAATWKKLYELLDGAYGDLETTIATEVFVDKAIIDAANIADGSVASNRLEYLRTEETDGVKTYYWNTNKVLYAYSGAVDDATHNSTNATVGQLPADTTTIAGDADLDSNGQPIIAYRYNEVNFAHQLGTWLHNITENDRFVLGTIGTSLPVTTSVTNLAKWIGTLPVTDINGAVTEDGTGLLGNKFMVGSTARSAGFYLTDTGTVDGNIQVDSNNAPVDLGKFLSVVAGVVVTPNSGSLGSIAALVNGGAIYTGLISTIRPGNSTTNELVSSVALPFTIKKTKLDELTFAGFVTFAQTTRGVVVVSGDLATAPASDYDYISTSIIVGSLVKNIRDRLQPYIGKGINTITLSAMETAVEDILQKAAEDGAIVNYKFSVIPGANVYSLKVPLKIVPVFELREVSVPIALSYDI